MNEIWNEFLLANNITEKSFFYLAGAGVEDQYEALSCYTDEDADFLKSLSIRL